MAVTSLLGSFEDYYANGSSADLTTLRSDLGTGKLYADLLPDTLARPYVILGEDSTRVVGQTKRNASGKNSRVLEVLVVMDVYAVDRAQCELILDDLEDAYLCQDLTDSSEWQFGPVTFENRSMLFDGDGWTGTLTLATQKVKSAS